MSIEVPEIKVPEQAKPPSIDSSSSSPAASPTEVPKLVVAPRHLIVLIHGINADSATLAEMHTEIAACLSVEFPGQFLVLNCSANSGFHVADDTSVMGWIGGLFMPAVHAQHKTRDGIDTGGDRLVAEIEAVLYRLPTVDKLSFFGHSLGGVYCRYVAGQLMARGWLVPPSDVMSPTATPPLVPSSPFASGVLASINVAKSISTSSASKRRIRLSHFFSFSAPHIGSLQMSETYSLGFMRAAASMILGKTCDQLLIQDYPHPEHLVTAADMTASRQSLIGSFEDAATDNAPATIASMTDAARTAAFEQMEKNNQPVPIMWRLCHEPYITALRAFSNRILYSNSENDSFVPFCTAALSRLNPPAQCPVERVNEFILPSYQYLVDVNAMLRAGLPAAAPSSDDKKSAVDSSIAKEQTESASISSGSIVAAMAARARDAATKTIGVEAPAMPPSHSEPEPEAKHDVALKSVSTVNDMVQNAREHAAAALGVQPPRVHNPSLFLSSQSETAQQTAASSSLSNSFEWPAAFVEFPIVRQIFRLLGGTDSHMPVSPLSTTAGAPTWDRIGVLDRYFLPHFDSGERWFEVTRHISETLLASARAERDALQRLQWQRRASNVDKVPLNL